MSRRLAVRAVVFLDGKLLCVRLKSYNNVVAGDYWCLPGGTLEDTEALLPALRREIIEETNIEPKVGNLLYVQQFGKAGKEHLEFMFHVTNAADFINVDLSLASHAAKEIEILDFVDPANTHILPAFLTTEPIAEQIRTSQPVKFFDYLA